MKTLLRTGALALVGRAAMVSPVSVLGAEEAGPDPVPWCNDCIQCSEDYFKAGYYPEGLPILGIFQQTCGPGQCSGAKECTAEQEEDAEALALITDLLEEGDVHGVLALVAASPDRAEIIPERNLLLVRGGCTGDAVIALRALDPAQTVALSEWVADYQQ